MAFFPYPTKRSIALMKIAKTHWRDHQGSETQSPTKLGAALFVESVKSCPKCAPAFRKLPPPE